MTVLWPNDRAIDALKAVFDRHDSIRPRRRQLRPYLRSAEAQRNDLLADQDILHQIGDETNVTAANRASIILLANETQDCGQTRSCLLTGDAAAEDILDGLTAAGKLQRGQRFCCDILKLQHHGAKDNFNTEFAQSVVADHYVISANGQHANPETIVMTQLIEHRAATVPERNFTLWFTCDPSRSPEGSRDAMRDALNAAIAAANVANSSRAGTATVRVLKPDQEFFDICMCNQPYRRCACANPDTTSAVLAG